MQRYRVNYRLLVGLAVGCVVSAVGAYGLWRFQIERKANVLIDRASTAEASGDHVAVLENLVQYLNLQKDDYRQWIRFGHKADWASDHPEISEAFSLRYPHLLNAVQALTRAEKPDESSSVEERYEYAYVLANRIALRTKLAEMQAYQIPYQALVGIESLREDATVLGQYLSDPEIQAYIASHPETSGEIAVDAAGDPLTNPPASVAALTQAELNAVSLLEVRCLVAQKEQEKAIALCSQLIGYNFDDDSFDQSAAQGASEPAFYAFLAGQWIAQERYPERVDRVIAQMVASNPESAQAFSEQSRLLQFVGRKDDSRDAEARQALARAAELDPDDEDVLRLQGIQSQGDYGKLLEEDLVEGDRPTQELLEEALELLRGDLENRLQNETFTSLREALASGGDVSVAIKKVAASRDSQGATKGVIDLLAAYFDAAANGEDRLARIKLADAAKQLRAGRKLEEALSFYKKGLEKYPKNPFFYQSTANVQLARGDLDDGLQTIEAGLAKYGTDVYGPTPFNTTLTNLKVDVLFAREDIDGVKQQIASMRNKDPQLDAIADFYEARISFAQQKWPEAAKQLQAVRRNLTDDVQGLAAALEGHCHERLGRNDLAYECYQEALAINPAILQAIQGKERVERFVRGDRGDGGKSDSLDDEVQRQLALPESQQDWEAVETLVDALVEEQNLPETRSLLYRAQILVQRALRNDDSAIQDKLFGEARNLIKRAYQLDPEDEAVVTAAIRLLSLEPGNGPANALKLYEQMLPKLGDSPLMRNLYADLLVAARSEQLAAQLAEVSKGMEDWPKADQAIVWSTLAAKYHQLGMFGEVTDALRHAMELSPGNLKTAMFLFDIAVQQQDEAGMVEAQNHILEIVGDKGDSNYVLTEVKRRIVGISNGTVSREEAIEGRAMLDKAIAQRPRWNELYILRGQFAVLLDRDVSTALKNFKKAREEGLPNVNAVVLEARLLADENRYREALDAMELIPKTQRPLLLGKHGPEILLQNGQNDAALELADQIANNEAGNAASQSWLGNLAMRAGDLQRAKEALQKAIELNPNEPGFWSQLVGLYIQENDGDMVMQTLRGAHLALDEEFLPPLTGKYYELFQRYNAAEEIYKAFYADQLDEPGVARRMAEFYFNWGRQDARNGRPAAVYVNKILHAVDEGRLAVDAPDAVWARHQAARVLANSGDYQDSVKAEKLLETGSGDLATQQRDRELLAQVLAERADPASQEKAVELLKRLREEKGSLTPEQGVHLGKLLFRVGSWKECRSQIESEIAQHPNDLALRSSHIAMLIEKREFRDADRWTDRLAELPQARPIADQYRVRIAARQGNKDEVRKYLQAMTPKTIRPDNSEDVQRALHVVLLAESVEDTEVALALARELSKRVGPENLDCARIIGLYGPPEEGLQLLNQAFDSNRDGSLQIAVEILRKRRIESPQSYDVAVERMIEAALRDDPDAAIRLRLRAEIFEIAEKFDDAIEAYERLLKRDDVPASDRAVALNNLAYVLVLTQRADRFDDALDAVNQAAEILGPISDILDTRAVVYIARKEYEKAVADMKMAIKGGTTSSKYFHLVQAILGTGDEKEAVEFWKAAVADGIDAEKIASLEQDGFRGVKEKIEKLLAE